MSSVRAWDMFRTLDGVREGSTRTDMGKESTWQDPSKNTILDVLFLP